MADDVMPPDRLYRIRPVGAIYDQDGTEIDRLQRELDTLAEPAIYMSAFDDLNDPFEFAADVQVDSPAPVVAQHLAGTHQRTGLPMRVGEAIQDTQTITGQLVLEQQIRDCFKGWGVCCFTEDACDSAMWGYYGEGHTGIAIEYDCRRHVMLRVIEVEPALTPIKVEYADRPPVLRFFESDPRTLCQKTVGHKSWNWDHEREWRFIAPESGLRRKVRDDRFVRGIALGLRASGATRERVHAFAKAHSLLVYDMKMEAPTRSYRLRMERTHPKDRR